MLKQELRLLYKQKRAELSETEKLKLDDLLLIQLQRLAFADDVAVLLSFWPIEKHNEVNAHLYTQYLETVIPHLEVAYPVINYATTNMQAITVNDNSTFTENQYGIYEPEAGNEINAEAIDVVFVPLLAFDKKGFRVGYGKGYYDKFLSQCRTDVISVGFSYFEPVEKIGDTHQYDIPLKYCITPGSVYEF